MERLDLQHLADIVGIYPPWSIDSIDVDDAQKTLTLNLTTETRSKYFGILSPSKSSTKEEGERFGHWQHLSVGMYRTIIRASIPSQAMSAKGELDKHVLDLPHFMGSAVRPYSNYLRQSVALARLKGIDDDVLANCMNLSSELIKTIAHDVERIAAQNNNGVMLPTEIDPVWLDVLLDKIHLKTNALPLKFLLSKLKLVCAKTTSSSELMMHVVELRKFFVANAHRMDDEVNQLCGLTHSNIKRKVAAENSMQRLVLPSTNNPIWIDLLTGKLSLNSQSIPLRLLISRQRNVFLQSDSNAEKIQGIDTLRSYFRKNCRILKPELVIINRALSIKKNTKFALPDPNHAVWQKILNDDKFIPSDHMAYKLLLSKLRNQLVRNNDPVSSIEAAKNIRSFISQNQKAMRNELVVILKQANAI